MNEELCYLSACEALQRFGARDLSPVELLNAVVERAQAIAPLINPYADRYFEQALASARHSEAKYQNPKTRTRRLEGLPLAIKDSCAVKGTRATGGSLINTEEIATVTDPSVERLLRAGANFFARTTCPEFCWLFATHSRLWGVTRNPWRPDITPGGSSGGSGAVVAAGATTIAVGTDSTGSIRQPAAQCGVVGYQAPYGRNPLPAGASFHPYVHIGPMTRTVADAALMQNVMSGYHPLDHTSLRNRLTLPIDASHITGLKIAYSLDLGHYEVVDDVRRETLHALDALRDAGAEVEAVNIDWASEPIRLAHLSEEFKFAGVLDEALEKHADKVSDYVGELAETAHSATADDYRRALTVAGRVWHEHLGPLMDRFDAFICPGVSCPEVPAENWQQNELIINGKSLTDTDTAMTALFNMFGRCPVLSVPSGMTDAGLPTGLQIVGRPYDDKTVFRIGGALERQRPWLDVPTRRPPL
tara:strand:- start:367 stop:1788 length:1422 start_codon:yes stop_codon:yes gene_type:complete